MINIIRGLYGQIFGGNVLAITISDALATLEFPLVKIARRNHTLLYIGYAVLFPITAAFHPLVSRPKITDWTLFPNLPHLIGQMTVFLVIDYASWHFFSQQFQEVFNHDDCNDEDYHHGVSSAMEIATDFTASVTTLILAITIIQLSSVMRDFTGSLHFAAVVFWLLARTQLEIQL